MPLIKSVKLFPAQKTIKDKILLDNKKWNIIVSSRQAGKTFLLIQLVSYYCINFPNQTNLYITPVYSLSKIIFAKIVNGLQHTGVIQSASKSDLIITFLNNTKLYFKSATNSDNIRGMSIDYMFIDEAAYINSEDWKSAIRPTMNVRGKQCIMVSTPKSKNFFYDIFLLAKQNSEIHNCFSLHYSDNPLYNLQEVEDARKTLPPDIFEQEYEGKFIDGGGSVFRNIEEIAVLKSYERIGTKFFAGLDLGRQSDYTSLIILNELGDVVCVYREHQTDWRTIINSVINKLREYNATCVIETNGIGDVIFEDIQRQYKNIIPFYTSNDSKQEIIEDLILAFNDKKIKIPTRQLCDNLYSELEYFTYTYSRTTRRIFYSAPIGLHDDMVMSLAFSVNCLKNRNRNKINFYVV